jgi:hypothetical protein
MKYSGASRRGVSRRERRGMLAATLAVAIVEDAFRILQIMKKDQVVDPNREYRVWKR